MNFCHGSVIGRNKLKVERMLKVNLKRDKD